MTYYSEGGTCVGPGYIGRSASTETNSKGYYKLYTDDYTGEFEGTATGTIEAYKNGYSFQPESREVSAGYNSKIGGQNFFATPLSYSISGSIVKVDDTAMQGVTVELSGDASKTTTTNENGYYTFSGLHLGSYTIIPSLVSYTPESYSVTIQYNQIIEFIHNDFTAMGHSVSGRVTASNDSPMLGVKLSLSGYVNATTISDSDGYYSFQSLYNGSYTITPSTICINHLFEPTSHSLIVPDADMVGQDFVGPVLSSDLSGTVTTFDGMALPGVTVSLSDANLTTTTTDTSGFYIFTSVYVGTYDVLPSMPSYYFSPVEQKVTVCEANVTNIDFTSTNTMSKRVGSGLIKDIRITSDDGYVVAGSTRSYGSGDSEVWVMKFDEYGNIEWQKTYRSQYFTGSYANSIRQTPDGGYVIAGSGQVTAGGRYSKLVLKLNAFGNIVWGWGYGPRSATSIEVTPDGGYVVAGYIYSYLSNSNDLWVMKLDESGKNGWYNHYSAPAEDSATSIQVTTDGGYIVAGYTYSYGSGGEDLWVLKLDGSGNVTWQKAYGDTGNERVNSIQQSSDGGYIVAGYTDSYGSGDDEILVLKLDESGNVTWQKNYGIGRANSIQETSDGGYILASSNGVVKLDVSGNITWQKYYGGVSYSIQETSNGDYVMTANNGVVSRINSKGELELCSMDTDTSRSVTDTNITPVESTALISSGMPQYKYFYNYKRDISVVETQLCPLF